MTLKDAWKDNDLEKAEVPEESEDYVNSLTDGKEEGFFKRAIEKGKQTLAGNTKAGKVVGFGLDLVTFFAPHGSKIDKLREKGKQALNLNKDKNDMKDAIIRGFTGDGGSLWRLKNEDGNVDTQYVLAFALRVVIVGAVVGALEALGIPVLDFLANLIAEKEDQL